MPGVTDGQLKPRQIRKVAVISGGLMGSGIATALLVSNISVVLKEVNPQFLQRGEKMIAGQSLYIAVAFLEKLFQFIHVLLSSPCYIETTMFLLVLELLDYL